MNLKSSAFFASLVLAGASALAAQQPTPPQIIDNGNGTCTTCVTNADGTCTMRTTKCQHTD